ncbi:Acetyltransferase (GNAT) domain-containing protein [Amycolatopsis xylanica]|uniref:Acetyltransferase (GNAT) domain-containing protein n=1 Tax=Amycolatopsis xylanica TaxID=589385 RepID=A0A1H2RVC8_9PSEU|nr:GNAT family N-acetyltransferase [Amycolatopsis xylanica]SDW23443.1 Acetyltransferase (GNAT) domain-containing protein [Amycolatopsis xylanica]
MKVAFSEVAPDYTHYVFPYHVWGFLEEGEDVGSAYAQGFLPAAYDLSRFYLTRSVRVDLHRFEETGRTRYVRRRCASIDHALVPRGEFDLSPEWRELAEKYYATQEISVEYRRSRFFEMLDSPWCTHVMAYTDGDRPAGLVPLFVRDGVVQYGIPVYDPSLRSISIGYHMMAAALGQLRSAGFDHVYLGSCYTAGDLYKTRFAGFQFFNGYQWSESREELHFFVDRRPEVTGQHFLGSAPYLDAYCDGDPGRLAGRADVARLVPYTERKDR